MSGGARCDRQKVVRLVDAAAPCFVSFNDVNRKEWEGKMNASLHLFPLDWIQFDARWGLFIVAAIRAQKRISSTHPGLSLRKRIGQKICPGATGQTLTMCLCGCGCVYLCASWINDAVLPLFHLCLDFIPGLKCHRLCPETLNSLVHNIFHGFIPTWGWQMPNALAIASSKKRKENHLLEQSRVVGAAFA